MNRKVLVLILLSFLGIGRTYTQDTGFYVSTDLGFMPYSVLNITSTDNSSNFSEQGPVLLGISPSYTFNNHFDGSIYYVFETHNRPLPVTSAIGISGTYFFRESRKSAFTNLVIGTGTNSTDRDAGSDGLYLASNLGYQFTTKREKPYRVSLGYSMQKSNDFILRESLSLDGPRADGLTHSIRLASTIMLFRSKRLK